MDSTLQSVAVIALVNLKQNCQHHAQHHSWFRCHIPLILDSILTTLVALGGFLLRYLMRVDFGFGWNGKFQRWQQDSQTEALHALSTVEWVDVNEHLGMSFLETSVNTISYNKEIAFNMSLRSLNCHDGVIPSTNKGRKRRILQVCLTSHGGTDHDLPYLAIRNTVAEGVLWVSAHFPDFIIVALCIAAISFLFPFLENLLDIDVSTHEVELEVLLASKRLHEVMQSWHQN
jgi:hypothetical protein